MSELHLLALILCLLRRAYSDTVFLLFADIFLFSEKVKFLLEKKKKSLEACSCLKQGTRSLIFVHCVDSVQTGKQHLRVRQMYVCCDVRQLVDRTSSIGKVSLLEQCLCWLYISCYIKHGINFWGFHPDGQLNPPQLLSLPFLREK